MGGGGERSRKDVRRGDERMWGGEKEKRRKRE